MANEFQVAAVASQHVEEWVAVPFPEPSAMPTGAVGDQPDPLSLVGAAVVALVSRYLGTDQPEVDLIDDRLGSGAPAGGPIRVYTPIGADGRTLVTRVAAEIARLRDPLAPPAVSPPPRSLAAEALGRVAILRVGGDAPGNGAPGPGGPPRLPAAAAGYHLVVALESWSPAWGSGSLARAAAWVHHPSPPLRRCAAADLERLIWQLSVAPHSKVATLFARSMWEHQPPYQPTDLHDPAPEFRPFPLAAVAGSISARYLEQARRHAHRPAVVTPHRTITYAELTRDAGLLAGAIEAQARPANRVALYVPHGPDMVTAILATVLAGRTYVPLDPDYPALRLRANLTDAEPDLVVTTAALRDQVASLGPAAPILFLGDAAGPWAGPPPTVGPTSLAYLLYTSGSTGRPKAVRQLHRNVLFQVRNHTNNLRVSCRDRLSLVSSFSFDMAVTDMFAALLNGAAVVPTDVRRCAGGELTDTIDRTGVTVYHSTPTLYRHLVENLGPTGQLRHVRAAILGGEEVTPSDLAAFRRHFGPRSVLVNGYGATEVSFAVQHHLPRRAITGPDGPVPIGQPLDGFEVVLLSEEGRPASLAGEIAIRGEYLSPGYWKPGPEDAARFTTHRGVPLYRTGDLARRGPNGQLYYAGRRDHQVKIRGNRVEPAEVERVIEQFPSVRDAVVVAEEPGRERLRGYVRRRANGDERDFVTRLRRHLTDRLPDYLVPAVLVFLDEFPRTATGKVDRGALARQDLQQAASDGISGAAPLTHTERYVAGLWRDVLGCAPARPDDDLVAMGGHSLTAIRLAARMQRDTGKAVTGVDLLRNGTLRAQAALLDVRRPGAATPNRRVDPHGGPGLVPASPAQQGLWVLHQLHPQCAAYHVAGLYHIHGPIRVEALRIALTAVAARHSALRTTFETRNDALWQRVHPAGSVPLSIVDLSSRHERERATERDNRVAEELHHVPSLERGPLFRAVLYREAVDRHVLLLVGHHIIMDGWSREIVQRDLGTAYAAAAAGHPVEWEAAVPDFASVVDLGIDARHQSIEKELRFWRDRLADPPPPIALPLPAVRPARPRFRGARIGTRLDPATSAALRAFAAAENLPLFPVLVAAFASTLARYGGQREVIVGMPVAGREDIRAEAVVGFFNNSLVLRCPADPERPLRENARLAGDAVLAALENGHVPFERLVREVAPHRVPGVNPIFQVWCNMLSYDPAPLALAGCQVRPADPPVTGALFDLSLYLTDRAGVVAASLVYDTDLLHEDQVRALMRQYETALRAMAERPDITLVDLPPLDPADRPARFPTPPDVPLPGRLRAAAIAAGERTAVRHGDAALSYAELNAAADRQAELFVQAGLTSRTVLAVLTRRQPQLAVAAVAALRAAVPVTLLDADLPIGRLASLLRRSRAGAVLDLTGGASTAAALAAAVGPAVNWLSPGEPGPAPPTRVPGVPPNVAYVAFTSGSGGQPQAVLGTEPPLRVFFDWYARTFDLTERDRFAVLAGIGHDPLFRELLLPLSIGATVCLPPPALGTAPNRLLPWLAAERVTVLHLTPTMGRLLAAAAGAGGHSCPDVRLVAYGGGPVHRDDYQNAVALFPAAQVISIYGTTETPQGVSVTDLAREYGDDRQAAFPPLGMGTANSQLLVMDPAGRLAPVNAVGEVAVRSPYLAAGYLDAPAHDARRFRSDVHGHPGVRVYLTGDRGRRRPDGVVEFLGRADRQVSLNGHRVELAEIEHVLLAHSQVVDCVVDVTTGTPDRTGDSASAVAYVVSRPGSGLTAAEVVDHLAAHLPPVFVPANVVLVPELPTTARGKPDLARLRRTRPAEPTLATADGLVVALEQVWQAVLGLDRVDRDDNIFDLGGTSLSLLRIQARLREALHRQVELVDLFRYPTIRQLAAALTRSGRSSVGQPA